MSFHGIRGGSPWYILSNKGIEVDNAKVEVIEKLPPPTSVKGVRSFLGHVDFYPVSYTHLTLPTNREV